MTGYVRRLEEWARSRGLRVTTYVGTQREPENGVNIRLAGTTGWTPPLLSCKSNDSVEAAALYAIENLKALGVDVP